MDNMVEIPFEGASKDELAADEILYAEPEGIYRR